MTGGLSELKNYYDYEWEVVLQEKHWPVLLPSEEHRAPHSIFSKPQLFFSPIAGILEVWRPSKKRRTLDRLTSQLLSSGFPGADLAVEYLRHKYSKNLANNTIKQAGNVVFSFLSFLDKMNTDILKIARRDIGAFIEYEQDRGLKVNSVRNYLRSVYTFIHYLIECEVLPLTLLYKKIRIKEPEILPKAIPPEDIDALLSVLGNVRDRALILLLLRTGMRIGELLNIKLSDIILRERKILIYLGEKNNQGREVYYSEDAERVLWDWLQARNQEKEYLFYSRSRETISYTAVWSIMRKSLERADLMGKGYSLHCLRHTFATDMLNAGMRLEVLQQLLGHQSIEVTRRYARLSNTTRENEYFKAMAIIEQGGPHEPYRISNSLQKVFEEKKLFTAHNKKLSS